jgi:O-antigen ligase
VLGHKPLFSSHAHNNILDVLASTGVFGLIAFLAWWILLWRYLWQSFWRSPPELRWLPAACLAAFVAFQVNGLTQVNFFDGKSEHSLMLWAGISLALFYRSSVQSSSR